MDTEISFVGDLVGYTATMREYVVARLANLNRYADIDVLQVVLRSGSGASSAEGAVRMRQGVIVRATGRSEHFDSYAAVDSLFRKLKRQLSEHGRRRARKREAEGPLIAPAVPATAPQGKIKVSQPLITVAWAPEAMSEFDYAEIVTALAAIVRDEGGIGVQRIRTGGCGVPLDSGVLA